MTWLLWKEYRNNLLIVYVTLFLLLVPYLIAVFAMWKWGFHETGGWEFCLGTASIYSLDFSQLAMALIGGNVIAGERLDRSAEFQAYLPIPRSKILWAKLMLALAIAAVVWLPNVSIMWSMVDDVYRRIDNGYPLNITMMTFIAITGFTFFCVAWFFSSIIKSPTIAVCAGLITPLIMIGSISFIANLLANRGVDPLLFAKFWYLSICIFLSLICFAIGTWHYLRRVEP